MIGVYAIVNRHNGKRYIGSSRDISKRILQHKSAIKNDRHHNQYLTRAWRKYGSDAFEFVVLQQCETEQDAWKAEQELLDCFWGDQLYNAKNDAFGVGHGDVHPNKGVPLSDEHKRKISQTMKGMVQHPQSSETRAIISRKRSQYRVTTPEGAFYGFANAGKFYGISEVAAKKRCRIQRFRWSYERM